MLHYNSERLCPDLCKTRIQTFFRFVLLRSIKLWNVESGKCVKTLIGHDSSVLAVQVCFQRHFSLAMLTVRNKNVSILIV